MSSVLAGSTRSFSTNYDRCTYDQPTNMVRCVNNFNTLFANLVHNAPSSASSHYCVVLENQIEDKHNVLSCSGTLINIRDIKLFNPLTPNTIDLTDYNVVANQLQFREYYFSDVRTEFASDITQVTCSDPFKTCVSLQDGTTHCFGNTNNIDLLYPWPSFGIAFATCILSLTIVGYFLARKLLHVRNRFGIFFISGAVMAIILGVLAAIYEISAITFGVAVGLVYGSYFIYACIRELLLDPDESISDKLFTRSSRTKQQKYVPIFTF